MRRILFIVSIAAAFILGMKAYTPQTVEAQTPPSPSASPSTDPFEVCVGKALGKYIDDVINGAGALSHIRYTSPAFNFTNPVEFQIYRNMINNSVRIGNLVAWAGNTYTSVPGDGSKRSGYQWYVDNGWESALAGKGVIFTEFGDFDTGQGTPGTHSPALMSKMRTDFLEASGHGNILGVNYFNALPGGNDDSSFLFHRLSPGEYQSITQGSGKAGLNSASYVSSGSFQDLVASNNAHWAVEIMNGPDVAAAAASVNKGLGEGVTTVLRLCVGGSCAFADPDVLVQFLRDLDAQVSGPVYVIIGPNEPATEHWAAPNCSEPVKPPKPFELNLVPCNSTTDPEWHSLRPYPASPCNKVKEESYYICGQDLVVKDVYEFTEDQATSCENVTQADGSTKRTCHFSVVGATSDVALGLADAYFPIMGNTEKVPNSQNAGLPYSQRNTINFRQRVNEYVSWYLNGIPYRAEEQPDIVTPEATPLDGVTKALSRIIDFGGPLKRLLPRDVQTQERKNEASRIPGGADSVNGRHDQIAACGTPDNPQQCYSASNNYLRITDLAGQNPNKPAFPYLPFSSTEDRIGEGNTAKKYAAPSCSDTPSDLETGITCLDYTPAVETRDLYFAHIDEDNELGAMLQKTFKPLGVQGSPAPDDQLAKQNQTPFCELIESRTNPGDKLYGELVRPGQAGTTKPISGTLSYNANFVCDFSTPSADSVAQCIADNCSTMTNPTAIAQCQADCGDSDSTCQREVYVPLAVEIKTPDLYQAWDKFVAGGMSIVKRIFPKIGVNTPISELKDIPGDSPAKYTSNHTAGNIAPLTEQALAGNPAAQRDGSTAKIYFPHIGSIYDYFLKDIQTALRPKGYGELSGGNLPPDTGNPGDNGKGYCTPEFLLPYFGNDPIKARNASCICQHESGSNPLAENRGCLTGRSVDFSIGLFQINLLAHCPASLPTYTWQPPSCSFGNTAERDKCELDLLNPISNIQRAVIISSNGTNWSPWSTAKKCGL